MISFGELKKSILGRPLKNSEMAAEKMSVFWGLPIMASDAVSSVAYAVPEILLVLVPALGLAASRIYICGSNSNNIASAYIGFFIFANNRPLS